MDVLITSYDLLRRDITDYQELHFFCEVIDEAQYIKNHGTQAARAVKQVQTGFRLALTGTPIENRLSELWSIFDYLMPGYLYSYQRFRTELEQPIVQHKDEDAAKRLQRLIRPFVLRRLKKEVLQDLPDKLEENLYADMDGEQQELYDAHVRRMKLMLEEKSDEEIRTDKIEILAELTRLRQLCCDPALLYDNYKGGSAKTELVRGLIRNAVENGHKVLLFSQFTTMLERLYRILEEEKIASHMLTGATPKEKRIEMVESFAHDEVPVFCISLKAGGTGLNLTAADVVIHFDPWWNSAVQNQATDRAHRIGQKNVVNVYRILAKGTIEEKIVELQERKLQLSDRILGGESLQAQGLTREELSNSGYGSLAGVQQMLVLIFFLGCHTAADMALGFVDIEYLSGFFCQSRIDLHQTFRDIFMYSGFADSKLAGSLSDGRVGFDNIAGYCQGTFFNIFFHKIP